MAERRISDGFLLRGLNGLDHERCAALQNYIIELGWTQRGLALSTLNKRTWWQCYGGDAALESTAERLDTSVAAFLKAAWHGFAMDSASKPHLSICDTEITINARQLWLPLEILLDGLVDMIEQGKILAVDSTYNGVQERTEPWIMPSYTERDLEESLQAFQQLVDAIQDRIPSRSQSDEQSLLEIVTAGNPQILPVNSFAHRFLAQCPRPAFTHISPGLSIAQSQPFAPISAQVGANNPFPLLLFTSTLPAHQEFRRTQWGEQVRDSPFARDFNNISSYPAGLYLSESDPHGPHPFEDGYRLVLPFALGSNAFARTSDGALIGEHVRREGDEAAEIEPKSVELYQLGFNHFIAAHDIQLNYVLGRWLEMIEEGKWEVDEHGVVGGVEKWREADTEEHWAEYQLPMSW